MSQNPYEPQPAASLVSGGYFPGQVPGTQASSAPAQRLVAMEEEPEEKMIEAALRPKSLDYCGRDGGAAAHHLRPGDSAFG